MTGLILRQAQDRFGELMIEKRKTSADILFTCRCRLSNEAFSA
jgi:hypothetical protein